jgi:hypothetical protein
VKRPTAQQRWVRLCDEVRTPFGVRSFRTKAPVYRACACGYRVCERPDGSFRVRDPHTQLHADAPTVPLAIGALRDVIRAFNDDRYRVKTR